MRRYPHLLSTAQVGTCSRSTGINGAQRPSMDSAGHMYFTCSGNSLAPGDGRVFLASQCTDPCSVMSCSSRPTRRLRQVSTDYVYVPCIIGPLPMWFSGPGMAGCRKDGMARYLVPPFPVLVYGILRGYILVGWHAGWSHEGKRAIQQNPEKMGE